MPFAHVHFEIHFVLFARDCHFDDVPFFVPRQDSVSVHRPSFYAQRFQDFMAKRVFKKIPSRESRTARALLLSQAPLVRVVWRGPNAPRRPREGRRTVRRTAL